MKIVNYLLFVFLMLFAISACTAIEPTQEIAEGYPVDATMDPEVFSGDSGYPIDSPEAEAHVLPDDLDIPDPSEGTAVVHGKLVSLSSDNGPYIAPALYLGSVLSSENGIFLGSISVDEDPEGLQASNGEFVFTDVPPGNYGLFIWTPVNAFIIKDETTEEPVVLEVVAGETYDLGTIYVP